MERYEPYYAQDTDGVHFQVNVDGVFVQAYVSRTILHIAYGSSEPRAQCLATYLEHREDIDSAIEVFTRINTGGSVLTLFEIMVAKTYDEKSGFDMQVEWKKFEEEIDDVGFDGIAPSTILSLLSLAGLAGMGDLVLTEAEVNPVMSSLADSGVEITALHNHLLRAQPATMYMHVEAHGDAVKLARSLRLALEESQTPIAFQPPAGNADGPPLDTAALEHALGHKGKANGGVYQFAIPRADAVHADGMEVPPALGTAIAINFQALDGGKAATTGDFVLTAEEVNPVLHALHQYGIQVTAIHNHMLADEPRLFFMHFWAVDDAGKLGEGLQAALANVATAKS